MYPENGVSKMKSKLNKNIKMKKKNKDVGMKRLLNSYLGDKHFFQLHKIQI